MATAEVAKEAAVTVVAVTVEEQVAAAKVAVETAEVTVEVGSGEAMVEVETAVAMEVGPGEATVEAEKAVEKVQVARKVALVADHNQHSLCRNHRRHLVLFAHSIQIHCNWYSRPGKRRWRHKWGFQRCPCTCLSILVR